MNHQSLNHQSVKPVYTTYAHSFAVGPTHDPYGAYDVTVKRGERSAYLYEDGLGSRRVELREGKVVVQKYDYGTRHGGPDEQILLLKACIRFRLWVGVDPHVAYDEHMNAVANDPMGSPSRYM